MSARKVLFVLLALITVNIVRVSAQEVVVPAGSEVTPVTVETLTLDRAINLALENNRAVKNARIETQKASDRVAYAKTYRLPQFKLTTLVQQPLSSFDTTFEKGLFGSNPTEDTVVTSSMKPNQRVVTTASILPALSSSAVISQPCPLAASAARANACLGGSGSSSGRTFG